MGMGVRGYVILNGVKNLVNANALANVILERACANREVKNRLIKQYLERHLPWSLSWRGRMRPLPRSLSI